jgi:hypothetical protein
VKDKRLSSQFNPLLDQVAAFSDRGVLPFFIVSAIDLCILVSGLMAKSCFENCYKLGEVTFESGSQLPEISDSCFGREGIKSGSEPFSIDLSRTVDKLG